MSFCQGDGVEGKFLWMDVKPQTMNLISDAYGKFSMMLSGNSFLSGNSQPTNPVAGQTQKNASKSSENDFDFCAPIGGGMELLGNLKQKLFQQHVNSVPVAENSQQIQALQKIKQNYREAAKTSELKAVGWGTTGSCYAIKIASSVGAGTFLSGQTVKDGLKMTAAEF